QLVGHALGDEGLLHDALLVPDPAGTITGLLDDSPGGQVAPSLSRGEGRNAALPTGARRAIREGARRVGWSFGLLSRWRWGGWRRRPYSSWYSHTSIWRLTSAGAEPCV